LGLDAVIEADGIVTRGSLFIGMGELFGIGLYVRRGRRSYGPGPGHDGNIAHDGTTRPAQVIEAESPNDIVGVNIPPGVFLES
jgi:hypothetical protein